MSLWRNLLIFVLLTGLCYAQNFSSSQECKNCHTQTYKQWQHSRHALSAELNSPIYRAMLKEYTQSAGQNCKKCHEPLFTLDIPEISTSKLIEEGISCDFCHATELTIKGEQSSFNLVSGNIKFGPYKDALASSHSTQYSSDLNDPKFCLVCHTNEGSPHGIAFIDLETEWKNSSFYKQDITCQDCHLPSISGKTASLGKIRDNIYNHRFFGGFNDAILTNCVSMQIDTVKENNNILVSVKIKNVSTGHGLPSASPLRMVILKVEAFDVFNNTIWKNYKTNPIKEDPQAVFMKLLEDENGKAPALPWKAVGERFDSRLMPDEERIINYKIPETLIKSIKASLVYYIAPPPLLRELNIKDVNYTKAKIISTSLVDFP